MSDKHYVGGNYSSFVDNGVTRPISRITLLLDDDHFITAGDDTGYNLESECPYGTQEMAEELLERLKGYQYQMFSASAVSIDPAAELGDGITVGGIYGVLSTIVDDGVFPDAEAPGEAELEDEYPTEGPLTRKFEKSLAKTRSLISKTSDNINLRIEALEKQSTEALDKYAETVTAALGELQSQIDGAIMTWFYDYEPTTENEPASLWTTEAEKIKHLGDVFYIVDNEVQGGQAYRWERVGGEYRWALIEDVELAKALADAARAQDTADNKRRVFTAQPVPPYDEGDLWAGGPSGDLMRCKTARESGSYSAGDWERASKYTDDSYASEIYSELDQKIDSIKITVANGDGSSTLTLKAGETELSSAKIVFSGFVTFKNLENPGETNINGENLTTGKIQDKKNKNHWDLNTGELVTNDMTANSITANGTFKCGDENDEYSIVLENARLYGYRKGSQVGYIDYSAAMRDLDTGWMLYGLQIQAEEVLRINTPIISVLNSADVSQTTWHGVTGGFSGPIVTYGPNGQVVNYLGLTFINGLCVGVSKPEIFNDWYMGA